MRIYDRYLLALGAAFSLSTIVLAAARVKAIGTYFAVDAVIYLAVTTLFVHFNPRARRLLDAVTFVVVAGLVFVVSFKAVEILQAAAQAAASSKP